MRVVWSPMIPTPRSSSPPAPRMHPRSNPLALVPLLLVASLPDSAEAQHYASGIYAEMELGATSFIGDAGDYVAPGPVFGLRGGYDLFSWLSVGGILTASTHEATVPPPPEQEFFQIYLLGADGRLSARLGKIALFGEGALGFAAVSTNVLDKVAVPEPHNC